MTQPSSPPSPPAQRLEIAFVERGAAEEKPKPGGKDLSERWVHAGEGLQTTAKWIITALAAVGAIMFAKGFVTTPTLDWEDDRDQLLIAWGLGVVGVIGIGWLIWATSNVLSPSVLTLGTLPKDFVALVERNPDDYLPTGATTVAQFNSRLREYRRASAEVTDLVRKGERELERAKALTADASPEEEAARRELEKARQRENASARKAEDAQARRDSAAPDDIPAAESVLHQAQQQQRGAADAVEAAHAAVRAAVEERNGKVNEAERRLENLKAGAIVLESNRDLYLAKRQELLERAQFWGASNQFLGTSRKAMLFGAALAAIGGIGFQLALSSPESEDDSADGASGGPYPRAAELVQVDSPAGLALWKAAELAACQVPSALPPTVPVTILSGTGSADDPFSVSTVSTDTCQAKTFPVVNNVGLIVEYPTLTIEYSPAPTSTSPSPTKTP